MLKDRELRNRLFLFFAIFLGSFALFLLFRIIVQNVLGLAYPWGDFRFIRGDKFKDFFQINHAVADRNPYITDLSNYPPLILVFAHIWSKIMGESYIGLSAEGVQDAIKNETIMKSLYTFLVLYAVVFVIICTLYALRRYKDEKGAMASVAAFTGLMFVLSAPSIFMMDRGNYLIVTVIFFLLWAICEQDDPDGYKGPVLLAICAATKIYPIYILGIYLFRKRWKQFLVAVITGLLVTAAGFLFMIGPLSENIDHFYKGVMGFGGGSSRYSIYFTVGITGLMQFLFRMFGIMPMTRISKIVWLLSGVILTLLGFKCVSKEEKPWKRIMIITALMVFLSPNSFLYNSAYMLPSIFLMLFDREKQEREDKVLLVISALLLVPKAYYCLPDMPGDDVPGDYNYVNIAVLFDALLYLSLILYYIKGRIGLKWLRGKRSSG